MVGLDGTWVEVRLEKADGLEDFLIGQGMAGICSIRVGKTEGIRYSLTWVSDNQKRGPIFADVLYFNPTRVIIHTQQRQGGEEYWKTLGLALKLNKEYKGELKIIKT